MSKADPSFGDPGEATQYGNLEADQIRLLKVFGLGTNDPEAPIRCELLTCQENCLPSYVALSYRWSDGDQERIILDGVQFNVGVNLERFLTQFRRDVGSSGRESRLIWIDALCINQGDSGEKEQQIRKMRGIYQKADHVIAWLGQSNKEFTVAMDWLRCFGQDAEDLEIGSTPALRLGNILESPSSQISSAALEFSQTLTPSLLTSRGRPGIMARGIAALLQQSYWGRIWIVQEIVAAKSVQFRCGNASVSDVQLHAAVHLLRNLGDYYRAGKSERATRELANTVGAIDTRNLVNIFKIRRAAQRPQLIYLLKLTKFFDAKEPRDMIFALLGLACDADKLDPQPDYSSDLVTIFKDTTLALLKQGYFDVWYFCVQQEEMPDLPSWCPNFGRTAKISALQQRALDRSSDAGGSVLQPEFNAGGAWSDETAVTLCPSDPSCLQLHANLVGEVIELGSEWRPKDPGIRFEELAEMRRSSKAYDPENSHILSDVCRAAVADQEKRQGNLKPRLSSQLHRAVVDLLALEKEWRLLNAKVFKTNGLEAFYSQLLSVSASRRPFRTSDRFGIGPRGLCKGDGVYCIPGAQVPYALRPLSCGGFSLVGEVYIHGAMDGEVAQARILTKIKVR